MTLPQPVQQFLRHVSQCRQLLELKACSVAFDRVRRTKDLREERFIVGRELQPEQQLFKVSERLVRLGHERCDQLVALCRVNQHLRHTSSLTQTPPVAVSK